MRRVTGLASAQLVLSSVIIAFSTSGVERIARAAIQLDHWRPSAIEAAGEQAISDPSPPVAIPFGDAASIARHRVGAIGAAAGANERLIYKNTLGTYVVALPANQFVSDDITTTAPVGCNLTRFRFIVSGKVNPAGATGPYTVRYALFNNCPQAVSTVERAHYTDEPLPSTGIRIRGASGEVTFPDDAPRTIEHVVDAAQTVAIPTNLWLGISFSRSNCGVVLGAPAEVGFSDDTLDFPGFPCNSNLGGFPEQPQASFWSEVYGGTNCSDSFVGYKAAMANGPQFNAGASVPFYDDVKLIVNNCQMIGYEVAVRGQGFYEFSLHRDCSESSEIAGTRRNFTVGVNTSPQLQLARFSFDPPIQLNSDQLYFRFQVANDTSGGVVMAGVQPTIGSSNGDYFTLDLNGACEPKQAPPPLTGVFHASITCAGTALVGACCDPYLPECSGGVDAGKRCLTNADCAVPGTCGPVCREVAAVNCPFPPRGQDLNPKWQMGASCIPDPFGNTPCGIAACCHMTENPVTHNLDEVCDNLTKRDCDQAPPLDEPRAWQLGLYCGTGAQQCPLDPCLGKEGSCSVPHPTPGCNDPFCCTGVCTLHGPDGAFCCLVEWDQTCVAFALAWCYPPPISDSCAPDPLRRLEGAFRIPVPGSMTTNNRHATDDPAEPGFCCHGGVSQCVGGSDDGDPCVIPGDCPEGVCPAPVPMAGSRGYGSVWFKFVQPQGFTSAQVSTCSSPAYDSLLQVFKAQDHSSLENECRSLAVIGCNDNAPGCSSGERNSKVCVQNLVSGETYYIMLAAKTPQTMGEYRVTVTTNCMGGDLYPNDYCPNAIPISDGSTPFNLSGATFDCPGEPCVPDALNDLWYDYTATCTGLAQFETCGPSSETSPNTNLVVYEGCDKCPPVAGRVLGCSDDAFQMWCGLGFRVAVEVQQGQCYKLRLADENGFPVAGSLTIACLDLDCQPNGIIDWQDIADCPPNRPSCADCNHNGVPDECDIRDGASQDENGDGVPDECQQFCHSGEVRFVDPPAGVVDARRPHAPNVALTPNGIHTLIATGPTNAPAKCWSMCETKALESPNAIASVVESSPGTYTIVLARPITPGAVTTLTYTDFAANATTARFTSHPGNVNGDTTTSPNDLLDLIDALNGIVALPWGNYSGDLDHSGLIAPADILEEIDLLNGANGYGIWNGTQRPEAAGTCP